MGRKPLCRSSWKTETLKHLILEKSLESFDVSFFVLSVLAFDLAKVNKLDLTRNLPLTLNNDRDIRT